MVITRKDVPEYIHAIIGLDPNSLGVAVLSIYMQQDIKLATNANPARDRSTQVQRWYAPYIGAAQAREVAIAGAVKAQTGLVYDPFLNKAVTQEQADASNQSSSDWVTSLNKGFDAGFVAVGKAGDVVVPALAISLAAVAVGAAAAPLLSAGAVATPAAAVSTAGVGATAVVPAAATSLPSIGAAVATLGGAAAKAAAGQLLNQPTGTEVVSRPGMVQPEPQTAPSNTPLVFGGVGLLFLLLL